MDKHYCSICGNEVDARDMAGFTEKTTCLKCACESTGLSGEEEPMKATWTMMIVFLIIFGALFYLAGNVFIY